MSLSNKQQQQQQLLKLEEIVKTNFKNRYSANYSDLAFFFINERFELEC